MHQDNLINGMAVLHSSLLKLAFHQEAQELICRHVRTADEVKDVVAFITELADKLHCAKHAKELQPSYRELCIATGDVAVALAAVWQEFHDQMRANQPMSC